MSLEKLKKYTKSDIIRVGDIYTMEEFQNLLDRALQHDPSNWHIRSTQKRFSQLGLELKNQARWFRRLERAASGKEDG